MAGPNKIYGVLSTDHNQEIPLVCNAAGELIFATPGVDDPLPVTEAGAAYGTIYQAHNGIIDTADSVAYDISGDSAIEIEFIESGNGVWSVETLCSSTANGIYRPYTASVGVTKITAKAAANNGWYRLEASRFMKIRATKASGASPSLIVNFRSVAP